MMDVLQDIIGRAFFFTLIIGLLTLGLFIQLLCNVIIKQVKSDKISDKILMKHYNMLKKYKDNVFFHFCATAFFIGMV